MTVVADVDPDTEGERETGSLDVEDRNLMARTVLHRADLVLVVGNDGIKGIHSLVRTLEDVHGCGVEAERIVPVLNRMPRSPRVRARAVAAIAQLLEPRPLSTAAGNPVIVPERRELEAALVDGAMLPEPLHRPVVATLPAPAIKLLFGQMGDELLLYSTRVVPRKLEESGFRFADSQLEPALNRLLGGGARELPPVRDPAKVPTEETRADESK